MQFDLYSPSETEIIPLEQEGHSALPDGWAWERLGQLAKINPRLSEKDIPDDRRVSFVPMKRVEELTGKVDLSETRTYGEVKKGFTSFEDGDVIFAKITPCMENGKIAVVEGLENGIGCGSTEFHVFRCSEALNNRYLFHFLTQAAFRKEAEANMTGAVGQRRVPKNFLEEKLIPLPPLPEQTRLVARLETLLGEVDAATARLHEAQQRLKTYRQAVLHHFLGNEEWERVRLETVAEMCLGKMLDKAKNKGRLQPYLGNINVRWGKFEFEDLQEMRFEENEEERYGLEYGDLIVCEGGEPGRAAIWRSEVPSMKIQKALHRIRFGEKVQVEFFYHFLVLSSITGHLSNHFTGTTIKHLPGREFAKFEFPLPDLPTQRQTVAAIETRLTAAEAMEIALAAGLRQAETLRQGILKRAFSGQL